ncbi:DNA translocase FtsK [Streptomyces sp. ADI92-24]|uniref:FtsK/SpoIIIE domain-containing protein n=1 Tax=Streptomyces sp. ADI92-24 TaxID=1522756 RepID=UPI000F554990|nr:FtsK/SpoIIIE domain-containing protein [Streptomyces sp. ADI92-24]RPK32642.1 DNA translocase FtsK [Streptomyces sp. ADI92-24]
MTQATDHSAPSGQVIDMTKRLPPESRANLEKAARAEALSSSAGVSDARTGTVRLSAEVDGQDIVVEQLDDARRRGLRALLPASLTNPDVWAHRGEVLAHAAGFHAAHSPVYAWRIVKLSSIGLWAEASTAWGYLLATDYGADIDEAKREAKKNKGFADNGDVAQLRAERRQIAKARRRENLTVLSATGFTSYLAAVVGIAEVWGLAMTFPALIPVIGVMYACGARELRRRGNDFVVFEPAALEEDAPLTDAQINQALRIAVPSFKEDDEIQLVGLIQRADINAAQCVFKLPAHVTVSKLIEQREGIAGALQVDENWLDIKQDGHPTRCSFWIATSDPFEKVRRSPLLGQSTPLDLWNDGAPIAYNKRGETRRLTIRDIMLLIGGATRTGKGMALRNLICALALDPRINVRIVDGKPTGEHLVYAPIAATMFGRDRNRLDFLLDAYEAEIERREDLLASLGESKMTAKLLKKLSIEILIIDELATYTRKSVPGAAARLSRLEFLSSVGAGLGVLLVVATQHPEVDVIPAGLRGNMTGRWAQRTADADGTNAILGKGATGRGMRAHDIPRDKRGLGWLDMDGIAEELARSFLIDEENAGEASEIIAVGWELRRAAGRLPGQWDDPIEAYLVQMTGLSSAAGGPGGRGKPGRPGQAAADATVLDVLLGAFEEEADRVPLADVRAAFAAWNADEWGQKDGEDDATYEARFGKDLGALLDEQLDGTDTELEPKRWRVGEGQGRVRGYLLAGVEAAHEAARKIHK